MHQSLVRNTFLIILLFSMATSLYCINTILYTGLSNRQLVGDDSEDYDFRMSGHHIGVALNNSDTMLFPIIESGIRFDKSFISIPTRVKLSTEAVYPFLGMTISYRYPHYEDHGDTDYLYTVNNDFDIGLSVGVDYINPDSKWLVGVEYYRGFIQAYRYENTNWYHIKEEQAYNQAITLSIGMLF